MLGLFEKLGPHVKGVLSKKVSADNVVFRLHYRLTVMLLLLGCFLVTTIEFIGDPILCMPSTLSGDDYDPENDPFVKACNTYCWIMSTFTLPQLHDKEVGVEVAHPGVGPPPKDAEMKYHAYYQWVPFFLLLQSIMFYATHFLWKNLEGGTLKGVLNGLDDLVLDKEAREGKEKQVVKYLKLTRGKHSCWYLQYVICEILNFCHVVGQIYFTDKFLGYEFTTYGAEVFEFLESDEENRTDPMTKVFPKPDHLIQFYRLPATFSTPFTCILRPPPFLSQEVNYDAVREKLSKGEILLLDCRNRPEICGAGMIPGSFCVPLPEVEEAFKLNSESFERKYGCRKPNPEEENVVMMCGTGRRAKLAIEALRPLGYHRLKWYSGSFNDWVAKGGDVAKS
ncbi:unnamed protein product [Darwinula stevensoni]|uniref:Innexin n=1 Tax=Darwinula stevensoni TaxID=69355 RepID=A0A7R9A1P4_9CRUS|nr:unnamed protein product [Darwinula stevensoni]CAG0888156.1 unnamed protein product [Darwinula stevensoni]